MMDAYLFLENRSGSDTLRVGTAWFRSSTSVTSWTTKTLDIVYGPLSSSNEWYSYAQPTYGT